MTDFVAERRRIVQRIIKKINAPTPPPLSEDYLITAAKYTGLQIKVLKDLESNEIFECKMEPIDRSVIYHKLVHFYTVKNKIPGTYELFNSLYGEIPPYIDIGNFRKLLVKMGFVWKKVSPTNAVVIENPLVRFERYNYLKKIQFYRSINYDIYYLDDGSYDSYGDFKDSKLTKELVVDVLKKDWVQRVLYAVGPRGIHALEEVDDITSKAVNEWVRDSLLPEVHKPSVFIINNNEHHNEKLLETPTLDTLKSDNKRWLDRHGVPYDPQMSKYELFALAEKYTDLAKNFYKIDEMITARGHIVLRIPKCIQNVTSAALLARVIDADFPQVVQSNEIKNSDDSLSATRVMFKDFIVGTALLYIEEFELFIANNEKELIEIEDGVDRVYDMLMVKVCAKVKDGNLEDSDLPSCSDSE